METIVKSFLCAIGIIGLLFSVISCASLSSSSSTSVSSSPIVIKKINSVNNLSSPPPPPSPSSVSPSSSGDEQPVDGSINSLNSEYGLIRPSTSQGESPSNLKPSEPLLLGDYHPIRSPLTPNFGKHRGPVNLGSSSSPSPSLTSSFSSSFSPSKLFPSLFSSTSSSRISSASSFPVHSFSLRPINRFLELFPRNDYSDESQNGPDNFPPKVFHHKRQQPPHLQHHHQIDKPHHDQQVGNSLSSPVFYSNDLYPDLTKQGTISRIPWFTNSFRGQLPPARKSTLRSLFDSLLNFG